MATYHASVAPWLVQIHCQLHGCTLLSEGQYLIVFWGPSAMLATVAKCLLLLH